MVHNGVTLSWYLLVVGCTTTAGFKLLLGLECLSSLDWVKTHRPCTANGSSRLDLAESFLVYNAHLLAVQSCPQAAKPILSAAEHEASSRTDCSGCLYFLCEFVHDPSCRFATNTVRHSKEHSASASTATQSPVEKQKGFGQLSTINEHGSRAGGALSASTESMDGKESRTRPAHSWLTNFLVDAHLSARSRRWEANSNGAQIPHAESNSNLHSDSVAGMNLA